MVSTKKISMVKFLLTLFCLFAFIPPTDAQLRAPGEPVSFTYLEAKHSAINFQKICCGHLQENFSKAAVTNLPVRFRNSSTWVKLETFQHVGILNFGPLINSATLFSHDPISGSVSTRKSGNLIRYSERSYKSNKIAFRINESDLDHHIYVLIRQFKSAVIAPNFYANDKFERNQSAAFLVHNSIIAAVCMIILFNILLGLISRQVIFLINAATSACLSATNLYITGLGPAYFWGNWAEYSNEIFKFTVSFGEIFGCLGVYVLLRQFGKQNKAVNALRYVIYTGIFLIIILPLFPSWLVSIAQEIFDTFIAIYLTSLVLILAWNRHEGALIMAPALFIAFLPGVFLYSAYKYFAFELFVPAEHVFEIMLFLEALLFSLILAYRMRIFELRAAKASRELVITQHNARRNLIEAIDNDRKRIASDLHDTAGQGLLAIANRISRLIGTKGLSNEDQNKITSAATYSKEIIQDIRRISHELHPAIVDHLGWEKAIEELFITLQDVEQISYKLSFDIDENNLDDSQKIHTYRIVQEILSNISKHSNASNCEAIFEHSGNYAIITITDDGKPAGKPTGASNSGASLGLSIIDQRVENLNGISSCQHANTGTTFSVKFPLT